MLASLERRINAGTATPEDKYAYDFEIANCMKAAHYVEVGNLATWVRIAEKTELEREEGFLDSVRGEVHAEERRDAAES